MQLGTIPVYDGSKGKELPPDNADPVAASRAAEVNFGR